MEEALQQALLLTLTGVAVAAHRTEELQTHTVVALAPALIIIVNQALFMEALEQVHTAG